jgi:hypothetical protein
MIASSGSPAQVSGSLESGIVPPPLVQDVSNFQLPSDQSAEISQSDSAFGLAFDQGLRLAAQYL